MQKPFFNFLFSFDKAKTLCYTVLATQPNIYCHCGKQSVKRCFSFSAYHNGSGCVATVRDSLLGASPTGAHFFILRRLNHETNYHFCPNAATYTFSDGLLGFFPYSQLESLHLHGPQHLHRMRSHARLEKGTQLQHKHSCRNLLLRRIYLISM